MELETLIKEYHKLIQNWIYRNRYVVTEPVQQIMVEVLLAKDGWVTPSRFVYAILHDDLRDAVNYGDTDCQNNLAMIYKASVNVNTYGLLTHLKKKESENV